MITERWWLWIIVSFLILLLSLDTVASYSMRLRELMTMNMVFFPLIIFVSVLLEGIYQFLKIGYESLKKSKKKE